MQRRNDEQSWTEKRLRRREEEELRRERDDGDAQQPYLKRPRTSSGNQEAPFVWRKKVEILRKKGIDPEEEEERQRAELRHELAAAKKRREQREQERAEWEAEQIKSAREKEAQMNEGWHQQEASFHGKQHFLRQAIRIREKRPAGTDLLAEFVRLDLNSDVAILNVEDFLKGLGEGHVQELVDGVEDELDYVVDFNREEDNDVWNRTIRLEFWKCVRVCVKDRLGQLNASREGMPDAVASDVELLLQGKPISKLRDMETEIDMKLKNGDEGDGAFGEVDFWQAALAKIRARIAAVRLKEITEMLSIERRERDAKKPKEEKNSESTNEAQHKSQNIGEDERLQAEGLRHLPGEDDEEEFKDEVEAPEGKSGTYAWNDKYRPRKPKYFNKVLSGYRWTKYNRTHYDHDNPPPKTVQGYMFNIFYPDLMDPSKTPTYTIHKTNNADVVIITFHSGPPYQDIAFKIVNRPWVTSHRRGYRCSFDKGVLQLWFNFDRYYYRR
ncbi:cactin [Gracilaria domingensis]|nr:cactin [Gracilaria domingensis]